MEIDHVQPPAMRQRNGRIKQRPIPFNSTGTIRLRRRGRGPVQRRGHEIVEKVAVFDDRPTTQNHEVMDVCKSAVPGLSRHPVKAVIRRPVQNSVQRRDLTDVASGHFLSIHLLQTKYVGLQALQHGLESCNTVGQRRHDAGTVVEALKIECCDAKPRHKDTQSHSIARPVYGHKRATLDVDQSAGWPSE